MTPLAPKTLRHNERWGRYVVPYVAAWSSETSTTLRWCDHAQGLALFPADGRRGDGRPVFGEMDMPRQRRVVAEGRCQVCARRVAANARYLVSGVETQVTILDGARCPLILEPWVCGPCLRYALEVCPGLVKRREPHAGIWVLSRPRCTLIAAVAQTKDGKRGISYLKLAVTAAHGVFTAEHWLAGGRGPDFALELLPTALAVSA